MRAVILAAGMGNKLKPFTESMSKVMLPIANKPILRYVVDAVTQSGIDDIVIVSGYKNERIMNYFGDGKNFETNIKYVFQNQQIGTGHALLQAKKEFDEDIVVLAGDNIIDAGLLSPIIKQNGSAILFTKNDAPSKYGVVTMDKGLITSIQEKPKENIGNLISTGIYKFEKELADGLEQHVLQGSNTITSFIQLILKNKKEIASVEGKGIWQDAVYPWDLLQVNENVLQHCSSIIHGNIEKGVEIRENVSVGKDTIIRSGSYIVGPVIIGEGCEIGPNTCIFPSTSIGDNVTIGAFSEIRNSILMNNVTVGSRSNVLQSVIGEGSTLSTNFTSTVGNAYINLEDSDNFHKVSNIGTFIGESCEIGSGVIVDPGKMVGMNCKIGALRRISENVKSNGIVV